MRNTHKFYEHEVIHGDECYFVDGEVSYSIEDNSFSYDYGDEVNKVHDPGPSTIEHEVTIDRVVEADDQPLPPSAKATCLKGMVDYFETTAGEEELTDACKP